MTPEERDRLRTVEVKVEGIDDWLRSIDTKLEELRTAANMGKGAWMLLLKLGVVLAAMGGGVAWLAATAAWLWDHVGGRHA
jgi:hypothetical protein